MYAFLFRTEKEQYAPAGKWYSIVADSETAARDELRKHLRGPIKADTVPCLDIEEVYAVLVTSGRR